MASSGDTGRLEFFISYTGEDLPWAQWIAWELERNGYTYRLQDEHIPPGSRFFTEMREWLDRAAHLLCVLSPAYFESRFASLEMNSAAAADPSGKARAVIPVRVVDCDMPRIFRDLVSIDLVGKQETEARRVLIAGLRAAMVGAHSQPRRVQKRPSFPAADEQPARPGRAAARSGGPTRVQFFACDVGRGLDLRGQYRKLEAALSRSRFADRFDLRGEFDVTDVNLFAKLNSYGPNIVHISGNQNGGDVLFPDSDGGEIVVPDEALAGLLSSLGESVQLVIVDTCKSLNCAQRVSEVVDCTIGVAEEIYDDEATRFYEVLYQALAAGRSVRDAHSQAVAALEFKRTPSGRIPRLCVRKGADASTITFAA